jgi:hypothetical protein
MPTTPAQASCAGDRGIGSDEDDGLKAVGIRLVSITRGIAAAYRPAACRADRVCHALYPGYPTAAGAGVDAARRALNVLCAHAAFLVRQARRKRHGCENCTAFLCSFDLRPRVAALRHDGCRGRGDVTRAGDPGASAGLARADACPLRPGARTFEGGIARTDSGGNEPGGGAGRLIQQHQALGPGRGRHRAEPAAPERRHQLRPAFHR